MRMLSSDYRHNLRLKGWGVNLAELEANMIFEKLETKSTKRGYPDFSIIKDDEIVGFVEVKPCIGKKPKVDQERFRRFCIKQKVPHLIWSPDQGQDRLIAFIEGLKEK